MTRTLIALLTVAICSSGLCHEWDDERAKDPWKEPGMVPDKETAIKIALAIVCPIYGDKLISKEKPFVATLQNGIWSVHGSLPEGMVGGVFHVTISHWDARILDVGHTL